MTPTTFNNLLEIAVNKPGWCTTRGIWMQTCSRRCLDGAAIRIALLIGAQMPKIVTAYAVSSVVCTMKHTTIEFEPHGPSSTFYFVVPCIEYDMIKVYTKTYPPA